MTDEQDLDIERRKIEQRRYLVDSLFGWGHILATLTLAGTILSWANSMDKRVVVSETKIQAIEIKNDEQDRGAERNLSRILDELRDINRKIDNKMHP